MINTKRWTIRQSKDKATYPKKGEKFDFTKHLRPEGELKGSIWVAGGAVLNRHIRPKGYKGDGYKVNDIDVYVSNTEVMGQLIYHLMHVLGFHLSFVTPLAFTLRRNLPCLHGAEEDTTVVQIIHYKCHESSAQIFKSFDFDHCKCAYNVGTKKWNEHLSFDKAVRTRSISSSGGGGDFPINALVRADKYRQKGWTFSKAEQLKLALRIANDGMPTSWQELKEAIGGMYGKKLDCIPDDVEFSYDAAIDMLTKFSEEEAYTDFHPASLMMINSDDIMEAIHLSKTPPNEKDQTTESHGRRFVKLNLMNGTVLYETATGALWGNNILVVNDNAETLLEMMGHRKPEEEVKDTDTVEYHHTDKEGATHKVGVVLDDIPEPSEVGIKHWITYKHINADLTPTYGVSGNLSLPANNNLVKKYDFGREARFDTKPYLYSGKIRVDDLKSQFGYKNTVLGKFVVQTDDLRYLTGWQNNWVLQAAALTLVAVKDVEHSSTLDTRKKSILTNMRENGNGNWTELTQDMLVLSPVWEDNRASD